MVAKINDYNEDWFEEWLMLLPDELEKIEKSLHHLDLDYSPESLLRLEGWILDHYPSMDAILDDREKMILDALLRYVGEVFRVHLQGKWEIVRGDPQYVFDYLPIIRFSGSIPNTSPLSLIIASIDRHTGEFIYDSLMKKKALYGEPRVD
ncbi:hypothetical protein EDC32_1011396 [Laceyella sacchari]|uniref:hypothetical protein n=1 Tax=Laceyella sacchari TaxID=37482 RepID=UPI00104BA4D3|nr:hypothetical protein [Laceyella sacchari]TCW41729.1 hypothetical protein EDC32_1011396 [Laceyella sacchari]